MGLLQKAKERTTNSAKSREELFPGILNRLENYKNKIEFYPTLFRELVSFFSIEKGALLINEEDKYNLSSIIGYDETTKNRLRLNKDELETYLSNNDLKIIKKYFSIRETVTLDEVNILTFKNKERILGVLLVSQYKTLLSPDIYQLQNFCSRLEHLWCENPLNKLTKSGELNLELKESIISYAHSIKNANNRIIFLKLSIIDIIDKLTSSDSLITSTNIRININKVLKSFIGNRGEVFQINNKEILLAILDKKQIVNISIIQQQILSAFKTIFSSSLDNIDLSFETLIWKDKSLENIIDHLIE